MRILLVHNRYRQPGGEDRMFDAEKNLLRRKGHEVIEYVRRNDETKEISGLRTAIDAVWSRESQRALRELVRTTRPQVVHFHNTFFRVSPAAYYVCREELLPVVQTLHNYRLMCPTATFFRDGQVCEDCMGKPVPWPGVLHGCWRNSRVQTSVVATMLAFHRIRGTWQEQVDVYIALTDFARRKFVEGGLPETKIVIKPNFISPDPGSGDSSGKYLLYAGRISHEKGIRTLVRAWRSLKEVPLKVVGDGPMLGEMQRAFRENGTGDVEILGHRSNKDVLALMKRARSLILPSEWYEGFPRILVEAFACGLPAIASRLGSTAEIIEDGRSGILFKAGNPDDLREKVYWAWTHPEQMAKMGRHARRKYERKYTAERNYGMLMDIYRGAINRVQGRAG